MWVVFFSFTQLLSHNSRYNLRLNVLTCAYPARCVVATSNTARLFERCGMLSCFVFRKQLNQNTNYKLIVLHLWYHYITTERKVLRNSIAAKGRLKLIPRVLSDLPRLHLLTSPTWRLKWPSWRSVVILETFSSDVAFVKVAIKMITNKL